MVRFFSSFVLRQRKRVLIAIIVTLGIVSDAAQPGIIYFNNRGLIDPETGEAYRAPIYRSPGQGWGATAGAYADLVLVEGQNFLTVGRTTFRTDSPALMPYLNAVQVEMPWRYPPGTRNLTFVVRVYPGLFGEWTQSPPFTVTAPLGGIVPGGAPMIPPGIDGFRQMGCSEAVTIIPEQAIYTIGENVQIKLFPPVSMFWSRYSPNYMPLFGSSSLSALRRKFGDVFYAANGIEASGFSLSRRLCKS